MLAAIAACRDAATLIFAAALYASAAISLDILPIYADFRAAHYFRYAVFIIDAIDALFFHYCHLLFSLSPLFA
jgi:hypothetical protein